jgi:cytidylate kinase
MDAHLRNLVLTKSKQIFDVWFLPWLVPEHSLKVWLECPLEVRARRIHQSLELGGGETKNVYKKALEKDMRAQQFARKTYAIDIFTDRTPFDVIISTKNDADVNLGRNALRLIAEKYLSGKDRGLNCLRRDDFASVIQRCPTNLYPA